MKHLLIAFLSICLFSCSEQSFWICAEDNSNIQYDFHRENPDVVEFIEDLTSQEWYWEPYGEGEYNTGTDEYQFGPEESFIVFLGDRNYTVEGVGTLLGSGVSEQRLVELSFYDGANFYLVAFTLRMGTNPCY